MKKEISTIDKEALSRFRMVGKEFPDKALCIKAKCELKKVIKDSLGKG